ncbi:hypothetical protein QBC45DRAFT_398295 [Copromyces sp. CBS 386.78]|nr:hypothetical protein QBC45DRAFT_398295 [Copromyces sp. CBS 386.78]
MRASTSTNFFTSLAIFLSTLTIPMVYAIPPPKLLESNLKSNGGDPTNLNASAPALHILASPKPLTVLSPYNITATDDGDWPIVDATTGPWTRYRSSTSTRPLVLVRLKYWTGLVLIPTLPWTAGCVQDFDPPVGTGKVADSNAIWDGIRYLNDVPGHPLELHRGCGQVSCSYGSAIFWCNEETDHGLRLKQFGDIADGARAVMESCGKGAGVMGKAVTGWDFKSEKGKNWSVVVTGGDC